MILRDMRTMLGKHFLSYLHKQGQPTEYELKELQERYLLLDWLASFLCFHRPTIPKHLFLYGHQKPKEDSSSIYYLLGGKSLFSLINLR
jgi:hypothetical protein